MSSFARYVRAVSRLFPAWLRKMRVISGQFRGRPLQAPRGKTTRPITDLAKETIFNILGHRFGTLSALPDVDAIDLFAGSGSFGIEALSRGARSCIFVERDRVALAALRDNLETLRLEPPQAVVRVTDIWRSIPAPPSPAGYGLAFVDPPYRDVERTDRISPLLRRLAETMASDGEIVFRHEIHTAFSPPPELALRAADERTIGSMRVWILVRSPRSPT